MNTDPCIPLVCSIFISHVNCEYISFLWRLVFIQETMENYIALELVWQGDLEECRSVRLSVRPSVYSSIRQFVKLLNVPTQSSLLASSSKVEIFDLSSLLFIINSKIIIHTIAETTWRPLPRKWCYIKKKFSAVVIDGVMINDISGEIFWLF